MARPKAPCGTDAAYRRHLRAGESPCERCRDAHRDANARYRSAPAVVAEVVVESEPAPVSDSEHVKDLRAQRKALQLAIDWALGNDPKAVPAASRELREVNAELEKLTGASSDVQGVPSLADQLAAARAVREARAAG